MISICLTKFKEGSWSNLMMQAFKNALNNEKEFCRVEEIFGYPKKHYDLIILVGINAYFYFIPSKTKLYEHYYYLPKFVFDDKLYPSQSKRKKLNVFVDHFAYANIHDRDLSIKTIKKIFQDLRNAEIPLNVFYHTSNGIEFNRMYPEIPEDGIKNCSLFLPFEEISEYYRQTDIFLPTHRESQGMLAQEIGACGGLTVLQEWMYPKSTFHQFPAVFYEEQQKIDFSFLKKILEKHSKDEFREQVLKYCSFNNFKLKLKNTIKHIMKS